MSKPVFQDLFSFSGRRNRSSYILGHLAWIAIIFIPILFAILVMPSGGTSQGVIIVIAILIGFPAIISQLAISTQRCRDIGWSGWFVLISAIPYLGSIFGLVLMFMPGTIGRNQYGPDPLRPDSDFYPQVFE